MKIQKLTVSNLKAISSKTVTFNGASALITGKNNSGKTTLLRGFYDRIRGYKPNLILKTGEDEGFYETEFTNGEKMRWEFSDKKDKGFKEKLVFITDNDLKKPLLRELIDRYFPPLFEVDRFLAAQPKDQRKMLQKLVGLDFTDIDARYERAYDDRQMKNKRALEQKILFEDLKLPEQIIEVSLDQLLAEKNVIREKLNSEYLKNKETNDAARKAWNETNDKARAAIIKHNSLQAIARTTWQLANGALEKLIEFGYAGKEAGEFVQSLADTIQEDKEYKAAPEPLYIKELPDNFELLAIDEKINTANETNRKAQVWKDYISQKNKAADAAIVAGTAEQVVQAIERERMELIKKATMPQGFGFTMEGITYDGLPFTREQLSSSGVYIAALKLAAMTLGEVKTLVFDASYLDRASLEEIEAWANANELQILIERPDFEGGDIQYELLA